MSKLGAALFMIFLSVIKTYLLLCDVNWQVHHRLVDALENMDWHLDIISEYCFWSKDYQDDQNIFVIISRLFSWKQGLTRCSHLNWKPAPCESFPQSLQVSSGSQAPRSQGRSPFDTRQQLVFKLIWDKSSILKAPSTQYQSPRTLILFDRYVPYRTVSYRMYLGAVACTDRSW